MNKNMFNQGELKRSREGDWDVADLKHGKVVMSQKEMEEYRKRKDLTNNLDDPEEEKLRDYEED